MRYALLAGTIALLVLSGCGLLPGQPGAARNPRGQAIQGGQAIPTSKPEASSQPSAASPGDQGGETKPAGYTDARYRYQLTGPGPLSARPDGTASFAGEDELLEVTVVEGAKAADPAALAETDLSSLSSSTADFQVLSRPSAVTLGGQRMIRFAYTSTGRSPATGRSVMLTGVRYYIPKNEATLAVVSYRDATSEFNAAEADGFAGSFRWL